MFQTKNTKFVFYRHVATGKTDNMPSKDWYDHYARHRTRSKEFQFIEEVDVASQVAQPGGRDTDAKSLPIIEDEWECPLCGRPCDSFEDMEDHKRIH